jgi:hypothetical protein
MYFIVLYMQITEEQCTKWTENPNQYIEDEDEDSFAFTVRISSQDLLVVSNSCALPWLGQLEDIDTFFIFRLCAKSLKKNAVWPWLRLSKNI